jgi:hypothetical protein
MDVEELGDGKDFKLYPGGGRPWDWSELLAHGATTVVLSRGMQLQLQVDPRALKLLDERGVTVHVAETTEAVQIYNDLAAGGAGSQPAELLTLFGAQGERAHLSSAQKRNPHT